MSDAVGLAERARARLRRWLRPPRRLEFTREGKYFVAITVGVGFAAINTGNNLLYLLLGMMLSFIIASGILSELSLRELAVMRTPPDAVYAVLERAEEYPLWWPQVREAVRRDADSGELRIRSLLPYEMRITVRQARSDPAAGRLEIAMGGDLDGWARWTVRARGTGTGTSLLFEQYVEVRKPLLRRLAVPGRPLFTANHAVMMRAGRRGLRRLLARRYGV